MLPLMSHKALNFSFGDISLPPVAQSQHYYHWSTIIMIVMEPWLPLVRKEASLLYLPYLLYHDDNELRVDTGMYLLCTLVVNTISEIQYALLML